MGDQPRIVDPDRALVHQLDAETAVLHVGPGATRVHLPASDLPPEATEGTWVVLDLQLQPPLVVAVDEVLTRERS